MNVHSKSDESYAQRIWRHFRRDRSARFGLGVIIFLFIGAALAPFLANNHAIIRVADGRMSFPIFQSLEPIEWRFLIYLPVAAALYFLRRKLSGKRKMTAGFCLAAVLMVEAVLVWAHPINDPTNDRDRPAAFKLMPPIPYSATETTPDAFLAPNMKHLCGTDSTGRDIASRMLHGARISLSIGIVAQGIALIIGITIGGLAGYYRGWVDIVICRGIEVMECFPSLLLILVIIGLFDSQNSMLVIMAVIGFTGWTGLARLVRGEFLRLSGQSFTLAAQAVGAGDFRIIVRHLLPNALGPILVSATFGVASAILIESSLSFLGFGIQAPTASWGGILTDARSYIDFAWWLAFFPGLAILITIMSYNFVGEALRDAVDPRLRIK